MIWFDAHLDLAYLAVKGRDMSAPLGPDVLPHPPAAITLPALAEGGVRLALGTIFTESMPPGSPTPLSPEQYPQGDNDRASRAGRAQLEAYLTWQDHAAVSLNLRRLLRRDAGVGEVRGGMGVAELHPPALESILAHTPSRAPLHLGILIENADPIRSPDELSWWIERGVVAVGLAWARPGRYAAGNATPHDVDRGLTDIGIELVRAMDATDTVHDVSHLSDRSLESLLELTDRPVIASHSNCRALLDDPGNQRHLRDESIREIARRGGVIGLNLYRRFIVSTPGAPEGARPTIDQALAHVERICDIAGSTRHVGLGSDMDGGLSANDLVADIDKPAHLPRLLSALSARGWSDEELRGFAHGNFARFFSDYWSRGGG